MTQRYLHFLGNSTQLLQIGSLKNCKIKNIWNGKGINIVYGKSNLKITLSIKSIQAKARIRF
jgi:hypothetical protein